MAAGRGRWRGKGTVLHPNGSSISTDLQCDQMTQN